MNVLKVVGESKYKVGDKVLAEKNPLIPLQIDGEITENVYYIHEQSIKGTYDTVVD